MNRQPPANITAEALVLGSMMLGGRCIGDVQAILRPDDFYRPAHGVIFDQLCAMAAERAEVNLAGVLSWFAGRGLLPNIGKSNDDDARDYLVDLAEGTPSDANAEYHAQEVKAAANLRRLIQLGGKLASDAKVATADPAELAEWAQREIYGLSYGERKPWATWGDLVRGVLADAEAVQRGEKRPGLPTGFRTVDRATGGMGDNDLWVVGAYTSVGKTAYSLNILGNVLNSGEAVLYVSGEMDEWAITRRLLARESGVLANKLRDGQLTPDEWTIATAATTATAGWQLDLMTGTPSVAAIQSRARRSATRFGGRLGLIVVDYLQLMRAPGAKDIRERIGDITWGLKALACDLQTPVLLLSQVNRASRRENRPPELSDLKESGNIENDANVVILLHDPEQFDTDGTAIRWLRVAKARDGKTTPWRDPDYPDLGFCRLRFKGGSCRFEEVTGA